MRTLKELEYLLYNPKADLVILASELRLLAQHYEWSLLWNALVFAELGESDTAILKLLQDEIRFPEQNLRKSLHEALPQNMSDTLPGNVVWKHCVIPYLTLRDQVHLSKANRYFFKISSDLYELIEEFPGYAKNLLKQASPVAIQQQLLTLRTLTYPTAENHLRALFSGVAKSLSPSEFLQIAPSQSLRPYIDMERHGDESLAIEKFSPLTLSCSLDKLATMLFFLSLMDNKKSEQIDKILNYCCEYGATSIIQFFIWAFPTNDVLKFDPYLPIACQHNKTAIIPLLAPRVQQVTMTMCLISSQNSENAIAVNAGLQAQGAKFTERVIDYRPDSPCYSDLMTEIIRMDLVILLSIFLKRWPKTSLDSLFYQIIDKNYLQEKLPLNLIAYILSARKSLQSTARARAAYMPKTSFSRFIHKLPKVIS